jgi:hypothetical protein
MFWVCLIKLSASSFENTPRNISDNSIAGFGLSVSSFKATETSTCLPMYDCGTDTETLVLRGIITVLVIIISFYLLAKIRDIMIISKNMRF